MQKRNKITYVLIFIIIATFIGSILLNNGGGGHEMSLKEAMKEAVLHEKEKVSFFGIINVNPAVIAAYTVTAIIAVFALIVRIFAIPKFKNIPGKFQLVIEEVVSFFVNLAKSNSPHKNGLLGSYIFAAGVYIFIGTLFELVGLQVVAITNAPVTLPAPLSDINAAIAMGGLSYLFIMFGGFRANGIKGIFLTLKDFSLPVSMSFRLFGALVSGLLVMDLVYHSLILSYGLPVIVAVLFSCLHAIIQAYVLTLLTSIYYGEVTEVHKKIKNKNKK